VSAAALCYTSVVRGADFQLDRDVQAVELRRSVTVIDDDPEMCRFMQEVFDGCDDFFCLEIHNSAEEAIKSISFQSPEIVLVDVVLPGMSGIECVREMKASLPGIQIVVLTGLRCKEAIREATLAGCDAYLEKPFSVHQLLATMRFCLFHQASSVCTRKTIDEIEQVRDFTEREQKVMTGLSRGLLYKEIAGEMGISFALVHKLQNALFQKLQARNRTEAINKWQTLHRGTRSQEPARP
jgi:DNA-binding NarL/FixJ family response regulator